MGQCTCVAVLTVPTINVLNKNDKKYHFFQRFFLFFASEKNDCVWTSFHNERFVFHLIIVAEVRFSHLIVIIVIISYSRYW